MKVVFTVELSNRHVPEVDLLEAYIRDALANFNTHPRFREGEFSASLERQIWRRHAAFERRSQRVRLERQIGGDYFGGPIRREQALPRVESEVPIEHLCDGIVTLPSACRSGSRQCSVTLSDVGGPPARSSALSLGDPFSARCAMRSKAVTVPSVVGL